MIRPIFLGLLVLTSPALAQPFLLPTANHAIFELGGEDRFFASTPGKMWQSGTFGCVRSDGWQMHEGLDIRSLQRNHLGEPIDPVMATADGVVAYINDKPSLSNYGRYIVLMHRIGGIEVFSLYAHLSEVRNGLAIGEPIHVGERIATMGRTSNTHQPITKDRAHVHFELNLFYTDHFTTWFKRHFPGERDDHGLFNGENLVGMDPRLIFLQERQSGAQFDLLSWIQRRPELCRVLVRQKDFPWLHRYPMLVKQGTLGKGEELEGYEISLDYNGLPFQLVPRGINAFKGYAKYQLLSVNEAEYTKNPCRRLVTRSGSQWQLSSKGLSLLELLTE